MKVRYLGHACFEITSKEGIKVITDPYTKVGYELPEGLTADILTVSHGHFDHNFTQGIEACYLVNEAKAYSLEGIEVYGVSAFHDPENGALRGKNIIYIMQMDGLSLCHMGDIGEECSETLAEKIGKVDVLFVPVGGTYTVDAVGAKKYIDKLQPKVVIPMHYKPKDGSLDIAPIHTFLDLYSSNDIQCIKDGILEINEQTRGIFYLERAKTI